MPRSAEDRETDDTLVEWAQGDDARRAEWAKRRLCARHAGLVCAIVKRYAGRVGERHGFDDLTQLGYEGLLRGVAKFDTSLGYAFATYVTHWIRSVIARQTLLVKPGEQPILSAARRFMRERPDATEAETAEAVGEKPARLRGILQAAAHPVSLDQTAGLWRDGELPSVGDAVADDWAVDAEHALVAESVAAAVRRAVARLPERERRVLELRFGFATGDSDDGLTLEEIAQRTRRVKTAGRGLKTRAFGLGAPLSRERVRQIEAGALAKVRRAVAEEIGS